MRFHPHFVERIAGKRLQDAAGFMVSLLVSPAPGQLRSSSPARLESGRPGRGRLLGPGDGTAPPCLLPPPRPTAGQDGLGWRRPLSPSSPGLICTFLPAGCPAAVPRAAHRCPHFHRPRHRPSRVSPCAAAAAGCRSGAFAARDRGRPVAGTPSRDSRWCWACGSSCEPLSWAAGSTGGNMLFLWWPGLACGVTPSPRRALGEGPALTWEHEGLGDEAEARPGADDGGSRQGLVIP